MPFSTIPAAGFSRSATPTSSELYADVAVVVPARDEAAAIGPLVRSLARRCAHVIVVDDGSTDDTARLAEAAGAEVLRRPRARGKGAAIRSGLLWARARPVQWIALIDGDGQHALTDLDRLVAAAKRRRAALAIGQRRFDARMPWARRVTNRVMSAVLHYLSGARVPDSQCGLRVLSRAASRALLPRTTGYEVESELLLRAARARLPLTLLPIETLYRPGGKSGIRPAVDAVRWIRFLLFGGW